MGPVRHWTTLGAVLAGLAVAAGAFGAHGIDRYFTAKYGGADDNNAETVTVAGKPVLKATRYLDVYRTAVRYQMYHALALLVVGLLGAARTKNSLQVAGWCFTFGIALFSGSLYLLTLTGTKWWGIVTPFGGLLLIFGWIALAIAAANPNIRS